MSRHLRLISLLSCKQCQDETGKNKTSLELFLSLFVSFFFFFCKTRDSSLKNKVPFTLLDTFGYSGRTRHLLFNRYVLKAFFAIVVVEINNFLYWSILKK